MSAAAIMFGALRVKLAPCSELMSPDICTFSPSNWFGNVIPFSFVTSNMTQSWYRNSRTAQCFGNNKYESP